VKTVHSIISNYFIQHSQYLKTMTSITRVTRALLPSSRCLTEVSTVGSLIQRKISIRTTNAIKHSTKAPSKSHKSKLTTQAKKDSSTSSDSAVNDNASKAASQNRMENDPDLMAIKMVQNSTDSRISGTDALSAIAPAQKMKNYGTALVLFGFCTGVYLYSIQSVGRPEGGLDELREEAEEARNKLEMKRAAEKETEEMMELDTDDFEDVAVAAPDDIAQKEEDLLNAGSKSTRRPLWKRVVFFWRRD